MCCHDRSSACAHSRPPRQSCCAEAGYESDPSHGEAPIVDHDVTHDAPGFDDGEANGSSYAFAGPSLIEMPHGVALEVGSDPRSVALADRVDSANFVCDRPPCWCLGQL